jgi:hypothetical protein
VLDPQGCPVKVDSLPSSKHIKMISPLGMLGSQTHFNYSWSIVSRWEGKYCNNRLNIFHMLINSEKSFLMLLWWSIEGKWHVTIQKLSTINWNTRKFGNTYKLKDKIRMDWVSYGLLGQEPERRQSVISYKESMQVVTGQCQSVCKYGLIIYIEYWKLYINIVKSATLED